MASCHFAGELDLDPDEFGKLSDSEFVNTSLTMEDFKVSAVQMNALKDDLDHNLDVHVRFTEEAGQGRVGGGPFPGVVGDRALW